MILPIYTYGQPVLRQVAQDIPTDYPDLQQFISDMYETLDASSGVGLAAPQVGKSIRVVVIDLDVLKDDFPEYAGYRHAFINSHIVDFDEKSGKETLEEGCLSIPGMSEKVERFNRIHVQYLDENLQPHDEWVEGYLARVMQHEFDHLEGKMYVDRVSPFRKQLIRSKLRAIMQGKYNANYRTKQTRR
ncbi:MAG: peptide deformylase [Prevotella sp.]|nr:peptide deformylase [Prevotella sp.]